MLYRLVVLVLLLTPIAIAAPSPASCPPLPSTCSCEPGNSGMLLVSCEGAILPSLFRDLGALPLEQLRITKCSQPNLDVLPKGPIHSLEISECGIQRIDSKIFANTVNMIEEIILSNNSLTEVPDFGTLPRLVNLDLNGNKISSVPDRVFAGIQNIQQLRMERNNICSLSDKAFVEVKNSLRLLDLSGNCLSKVPAVNLRNSQKLMFLDLANNDISEIKDFELMNMPLLQEIRLNNNELRSLQPRAIMNVPQLKYLFIRDNLLSSLDGDKLQELSQLEVLDVTNNRLPKVPKLKNFPKLKQVLLDDNRIEQIDELTFSNCTQLQLISLQNNNIARVAGNSFDTLDQMQVLLLGNNSLSSIDRGTLDGMRSLAFLHARNNSISKIDPHAFTSVLNLHSIDLAHNALKTIEPKTFQNLGRLMWLDVSNNHLQGFEKDTFNQKIETMLLDGNEWVCDEKFDWFVTFLVTNRVRTFLPQQNEIQCSGPAQYQGVRLRDLMVRKANDTITEGMKTLGLDKQGQKSLISSFIPGLETWNQAVSAQQLGNMASGIPILNTITQAIPSLRTLPLMGTSQTGAQPVPQHRNLNNAIEQFTAPIVRFATGGQPVASDVSQFIQSIPNFVVNIPGFGDFDLSKINPDLVDFVLQGNTVPGVPKETMDGIIQNYMKKVYNAAAAAKAGKLTKDQKKYLLPMSQLPKKMVQSVMAGQLLPGLTEDQTRTVTEYYATAGSPASVSSAAAGGSTSVNPAAVADLWKLLPPDYNISKIPQEVIGAVMKGELPDLKQLPTDLMAHFQANADKMASMFAKLAPANVTLDDLLAKLPRFEKPILATFSPYDINKLSSDMIHEEKIKETSEKMKLYTAIALGGIGGITIICCIFLVAYLMRHRLNKTRSPEESAPIGTDETLLGTGEAASTPSTPPPRVVTTPGPPLANSTMRDPPQAEA